jgi:hypothetical protein
MVDLDAAASPLALVVALLFVFSVVLCIVLMAGFVSLLVKRQEYVSYLRQHGRRIGAYVEHIKHWNGWSSDEDGWKYDDYYQIITAWVNPQDGSKSIYKSGVSKVKPRLRRGDPVIILVDPQNPAKYYMDI